MCWLRQRLRLAILPVLLASWTLTIPMSSASIHSPFIFAVCLASGHVMYFFCFVLSACLSGIAL